MLKQIFNKSDISYKIDIMPKASKIDRNLNRTINDNKKKILNKQAEKNRYVNKYYNNNLERKDYYEDNDLEKNNIVNNNRKSFSPEDDVFYEVYETYNPTNTKIENQNNSKINSNESQNNSNYILTFEDNTSQQNNNKREKSKSNGFNSSFNNKQITKQIPNNGKDRNDKTGFSNIEYLSQTNSLKEPNVIKINDLIVKKKAMNDYRNLRTYLSDKTETENPKQTSIYSLTNSSEKKKFDKNDCYSLFIKKKNQITKKEKPKTNLRSQTPSLLYEFQPKKCQDFKNEYFEMHGNKYERATRKMSSINSVTGKRKKSSFCSTLQTISNVCVLKNGTNSKNSINLKQKNSRSHLYNYSEHFLNSHSNNFHQNKSSLNTNAFNNNTNSSFYTNTSLDFKKRKSSKHVEVNNINFTQHSTLKTEIEQIKQNDSTVKDNLNVAIISHKNSVNEILEKTELKNQIETNMLNLASEIEAIKKVKSYLDKNNDINLVERKKQVNQVKSIESRGQLMKNELNSLQQEIENLNKLLNKKTEENKQLFEKMVKEQESLNNLERNCLVLRLGNEEKTLEKRNMYYRLADLGKKRKDVGVYLNRRVSLLFNCCNFYYLFTGF